MSPIPRVSQVLGHLGYLECLGILDGLDFLAYLELLVFLAYLFFLACLELLDYLVVSCNHEAKRNHPSDTETDIDGTCGGRDARRVGKFSGIWRQSSSVQS